MGSEGRERRRYPGMVSNGIFELTVMPCAIQVTVATLARSTGAINFKLAEAEVTADSNLVQPMWSCNNGC